MTQRVLLIRSEYDINGPGIFMLQIAKELMRRGISVWSVSGGGDLVPEIRRAGIHTCVWPELLVGQRSLMGGWRVVRRLRELIEREGITVLHAHNGISALYAQAAARLAKNRPEVVTTVHGMGREWLYKLGPRKVIAVSEAVRTRLREHGIEERRIHVLHNGIIDPMEYAAAEEVELASLRRDVGLEEGDRVIGVIAYLVPKKGHRILFDALARLQDCNESLKVLVIGDGPERQALEAYAEEQGVRERVVFAGFRRDIPQLVQLLDILVLPSLQETFGMVLLEGMAGGVPVVGSRTGGIPEVIDEGKNGRLFAPGDAVELAAILDELLHDPALAKRLGEGGKRAVLERYTIERFADRLLALYAGQGKREVRV